MNIETLINQLIFSENSVKLSDVEYLIEDNFILHIYKSESVYGFELFNVNNVSSETLNKI